MPENKTLKTLLSELGESSSLHGIPKIVSSRQVIVKVMWCVLLLGTMAVFAVQLHGLFQEYYAYPTKTTVRLNFKPLGFPAITFCNMNPMKRSRMWKFDSLSQIDLNAFLAEYFDQFYVDPSYLDEEITEEYNNTRDKYDAWKTRFLIEYKNISSEDRLDIGHQKNTFIHSAIFSGHRLPSSIFKTIQSHVYGNCFTLDQDELIARGSGHTHSLYIVFNIETDEYLVDYTSAYGVRMVVHEKGTYPLPEQEGVTLSTKMETHIGMRMSRISRLGGKYGECTDGQTFLEKYNVNYTVPICYSVCEIESMVSQCECVPLSSIGVLDRATVRMCDFDNDELCAKSVTEQIHYGQISCNCRSRCEESVFTTTLSSRLWPHDTYLKKVLLEEGCKRNTSFTSFGYYGAICELVRNNSAVDKSDLEYVANNFLAVYVYFEDLNFESIKEEPLYNTVRFLSDIGGAMGLYIGASVLTYVEILQVILEIILFYRRKSLKTVPIEK